MKILVSLGCSWTNGKGLQYEESMSKEEYIESFKDEAVRIKFEKLTFRGLLSDKLDAENINLSESGSSNQRQIRKAKEFFLNQKDNWFNNDIIVIWGLTSVYRNEIWNIDTQQYENIFYKDDTEIDNVLLKYFDMNKEIKNLSYEIKLWNEYFKIKNIKNYWYNTFNYHKYNFDFDNLLWNGKDLLSILINSNDNNDYYHKSVGLRWEHAPIEMDKNILKALELKRVNPISKHPNKESHIIIADMMEKELLKER